MKTNHQYRVKIMSMNMITDCSAYSYLSNIAVKSIIRCVFKHKDFNDGRGL